MMDLFLLCFNLNLVVILFSFLCTGPFIPLFHFISFHVFHTRVRPSRVSLFIVMTVAQPWTELLGRFVTIQFIVSPRTKEAHPPKYWKK